MNKDNGMHLLCYFHYTCFIYSVVPQHLPVVEKFQEVNYSEGCTSWYFYEKDTHRYKDFIPCCVPYYPLLSTVPTLE